MQNGGGWGVPDLIFSNPTGSRSSKGTHALIAVGMDHAPDLVAAEVTFFVGEARWGIAGIKSWIDPAGTRVTGSVSDCLSG